MKRRWGVTDGSHGMLLISILQKNPPPSKKEGLFVLSIYNYK
ncbi:hypothetical protein [Clostridium algidicarnis]|nr:hypothetical protein [Clostridium algidicarnis]